MEYGKICKYLTILCDSMLKYFGLFVHIKENDGENKPLKRVKVNLLQIRNMSLVDFATKNSRILFERMQFSEDFLEVDPEDWNEREDFQNAKAVIKDLKVVNDHAERGVALVQELSGILTKNEEQFQFLMQVVQDNRRLYPNALKRTLLKQ